MILQEIGLHGVISKPFRTSQCHLRLEGHLAGLAELEVCAGVLCRFYQFSAVPGSEGRERRTNKFPSRTTVSLLPTLLKSSEDFYWHQKIVLHRTLKKNHCFYKKKNIYI